MPQLISRSRRPASAIRVTAWGFVAVGVLAPLVRKRVSAHPIVMQAAAFAAPVGLCVAVRRSRKRDVVMCCLQMWAYLAAYETPHDDPGALERRVHVGYPIAIDKALGCGHLPTVRLQRALARSGPDGPEWRVLDRVLVWAHWMWFLVPHSALAYILWRHPARFPRAAVMTYAVFDIGAMIYWLAPTAPPWYAASRATATVGSRGSEGEGGTTGDVGVGEQAGLAAGESMVAPEVRRMMVEYGESFWKDGWGPLYSVLGGNPLAAMPSLHFATSVMAALLLTEAEPSAGGFGFVYATTLGFALVYLGEHYVVDLLAGAALTSVVWRLGPRAGPALSRVGRGVAALEDYVHGAG